MGRPGLKVLYISRGFTTHDRRFLASFVGAGWSPVHLPIIPERLDHRDYPEGVSTAAWSRTQWPSSKADWRRRIAELSEIIDAVDPAVVLAGPVQSGALMAALAGASPLVSVSWGSDVLVDADADSLCRHATSRALDASVLAFGDCRAVREAVKRHSALDDSDIVTFPWGIDLGRF
ncbi:MAG: glycosyltransferase, partial [Gemmatimonadaceae bacterium]